MYLRILFFLILSSELIAQHTVRGYVIDSIQKRPLAFVSISIEGFAQISTMSDIDGQFALEIPMNLPVTIQFTSLGFTKQTVKISENETSKLLVEMNPSSLQLREFEVKAGENPAYRIIRKTWENRKYNDPENLDSYKCITYNKLVLTGRRDTAFKAKNELDIRRAFSADSFLEQQHLFLIESSNERLFRKGKVKENVIASRISGLKEASIFMLALQFQPFGFYAPLIELDGKKLLNPISKNSEDVYEFSLGDTLFQGSDSIYVIQFKPRKNATIDGLKGVIYISAPDYAIQNIIASPNDEKNSMQMSVQQQYKRDKNGVWFPEQLNTDIAFLNINLTGQKTFGESRTYIRNVEINPLLSAKIFDEVELNINTDAAEKDSIFWKDVRIEELGEKEKRTYYFVDSLSKADGLDRKLKSIEALIRGYIPINFFDLELNRILRFNNFEGFRLGAGGITNDRLSSNWGIGGYLAYGFKDRGFKFGLEGRYYINPKQELELRTLYSDDVLESGAVFFEQDSKSPRSEQIRQALVSRMDAEERTEVHLSWRSFKYLKSDVFVRQSHVSPLYVYSFSNLPNSNRFSWLETGISLSYCYKERFYRNGKLKISLGSKHPTFRIQYSRGEDLSNAGQCNFNKLLLRIDYGFQWRRIGKTFLQLLSGYVDGNVPYCRLFNGKGNLTDQADLRVSSMNCFETMLMNEFVSNQFISSFLYHDFGPFFKIKNFKPHFAIAQNIHVGKNANNIAINHNNIGFQAANRGYFESGLQINNLLSFNTGGYGIAGYYRMGYYASKEWKKNFALKLTLSILF